MNQYPRAFEEKRKTPRPPRVPVPLDQRPENRRSVPRAVNVRALVFWVLLALVLFAVLALVVVR